MQVWKSEVERIRAAQQGDLQAFEDIVRRYQQRVLGTAYRLVGNATDAQDVAQEVFVRMFRSLRNFRTEQKFFTWLYRIIVNVCWDFLRREKKFRSTAVETLPQDHAALIHMTDPDGEEGLWALHKLAERLSTAQKTTFLLREIEGFSCKEIARILACPTGTVRSHLFHARRNLRELLKKHYPEFLEGSRHEKVQQ